MWQERTILSEEELDMLLKETIKEIENENITQNDNTAYFENRSYVIYPNGNKEYTRGPRTKLVQYTE